jgi:hypothetical protein
MTGDERMPPPAAPESPTRPAGGRVAGGGAEAAAAVGGMATDAPAGAGGATTEAPAGAGGATSKGAPGAGGATAEGPAGAAAATVEAPSPDVELAQEASPLPGEHRGGFSRLPTAPVPVTVETAPAEPGGEFSADAGDWVAPDGDAFSRGLAGWALAFGIIGLIVSLFVGWGFPIGLVAVVSAIIALRRPLESRAVAVWAIALGTVSILYSAGWLLFGAMRANLFG